MDRLQLNRISFAKVGAKLKKKIKHEQKVRKQATKSSGSWSH